MKLICAKCFKEYTADVVKCPHCGHDKALVDDKKANK
jgi:DNA-directed RNA polymerase subunit RPC12/RpoP